MKLLPEIGEEVIQAWVGNKAFQRGYKYFEDDAVLNPRKRGMNLIAECQGSQPMPYRVEICLGMEGIESGNCTCPAGEGGHCKHAAALLLTWIYEPVLFTEMQELEPILEKYTKQELIALIQQMVTRHSDLEQLLELSALSNLDAGETLQPAFLVQQVKRAFSVAGGEWGNSAVIAENLRPLLDLGQNFLEKDDVRNAAAVFQTLMETLLSYEDSLDQDEGGYLRQILSESEQGIEDCLEDLEDESLRASLVRLLFDFYLWDLQRGRHGFADETPMILLEQASPKEKQQITSWIRTVLEEVLPETSEQDNLKARRKLGGLWLELVNGGLDDEEYLRICRETGRTQDMVDRLLALGRVEEAEATARQEPVNSILPMADLFEKYGHPEIGWQVVKDMPDSDTNISLLEWMQQFAARHDRPQEALQLAESLFWQAQSLSNYNALVDCASELGQRDEVRLRVLSRLESAGNFPLLVEIYLMEREVDLALAALERVNAEIWWDRLSMLRGKVALAVEIPRPREAIRQYLLLAEDLIGNRSRGSYAEAARFLKQVRKLYQGLGEPDQWRRLIVGFRQEYRRLPALQDEMRRAGLLDNNY